MACFLYSLPLGNGHSVKNDCHSERSEVGAKSKNQRIFCATVQIYDAKILRLALLAQDDKLN